MEAQRGNATLSLTSAPVGGGWLRPRPGRFTSVKERGYMLYRRLGEPEGRSERVRKILPPPPGSDPRTVQPVGSRKEYVDSYFILVSTCYFSHTSNYQFGNSKRKYISAGDCFVICFDSCIRIVMSAPFSLKCLVLITGEWRVQMQLCL